MTNKFEKFVQSGLYLRGWSTKTPIIYRRAFASFQQSLPPEISPSTLCEAVTKAQLEAWVISMRQRGRSAAGVNIYIRAMNAFCSWLKEEGHTKDHIKLKQLKALVKPVTVFSEAEVKALLAARPKRLSYLRTWTLIVLLLDTGCRIDEVLNLRTKDIDFDNLLLTVDGKGGKTRRVPFSPEMRKFLFRYTQRLKEPSIFLFGTRTGTRLRYRNAYRNIKLCFKTIDVEGEHVHPHNLRHTFACTFIKRGGNIFSLSRILGHSSVTTTQVYLRGLQVEDLTHHSILEAS